MILSESEQRVRSRALPGGDLVSAVLNRHVMALADRGGASGMVGQRWADITAERADLMVGATIPIPGGDASHVVERVFRLDDNPAIAGAAAKQGLQNPDLLLLGRRSDGTPTLQAADAKFSVETARSKQVSAEVVEGLLPLPGVQRILTGANIAEVSLVQGFFFCPDSVLTHLMFNGRQGITRTTVKRAEVLLLDASATEFLAELEGAPLIPLLESIDRLPVRAQESLLAALYYFRLVRACAGCWIEEHRPLLAMNDTVVVDLSSLQSGLQSRVPAADSAFRLVLDWEEDLEVVRNQRTAVEQVAGLPMANRDLRAIVEREAERLSLAAPSVNKVRRRLGAWYRAELRAQVGDLRPPVHDLGAELDKLAIVAKQVSPGLEEQARRIVRELAAPKQVADAEPSKLA